MKLHRYLITAALLAASASAQQTLITGLAVSTQTAQLTVGGVPVNARELVIEVYPLNTPPPWPIGLWRYTWVQVDTGGHKWGQADWCNFWFLKEQQEQGTKTVPYLMLSLMLTGDPIETDDGTELYPTGTFVCSQVSNMFVP